MFTMSIHCFKVDDMSIERNQPRRKLYFAAPLFSEAELVFNHRVATLLEPFIDVYLPQRDGGLMSELVIGGSDAEIAACCVFRRDVEAILESDFLVAVLDGRAIDEGVAFELGVAYSHQKRCFALQTDSRRLATWGNNPMITGALERSFDSVDELVRWFGLEFEGEQANRSKLQFR